MQKFILKVEVFHPCTFHVNLPMIPSYMSNFLAAALENLRTRQMEFYMLIVFRSPDFLALTLHPFISSLLEHVVA